MTAPKDPNRFCKATRTDGEPCRNPALPGITVCRYHGGASPAAKQKSKAYVARVELAKFGARPDTTAVEAFAEALSLAVGMVRYYESRLQLVPAELTKLVSKVDQWSDAEWADAPGDGPSLLVEERHETTTEHGTTTRLELKANPLLTEYRAERDHLVKVASTGIRLGLTQMQIEAFMAATETARAEAVSILRNLVDAPELADVADRIRAVMVRQLSPKPPIEIGTPK